VNASLLAAVKLGDQIERFGSYAGYASVIGLGVLAMLYFSQAREVKRLREWAGRAPERDAEVAQRVQTDAQRRVVAQPVAPAGAPPAAAAVQPVQPAGPQTPAAQQAEAARKAAAAAVMQKFQQPGAQGTPPPAVGPPGQLARPGQPLVPGMPVPAVPAAGAPGLGSPTGLGAPATATPPPAPGPTLPPNPATANAVAAARQEATAARSPALTNGAGGQGTHESAAARPSLLDDDLAPRTARAAGSTRPPDARGGARAHIGLIAGGAVAALVVAVVLVLLLTGGNDTPPADNAIGGSPPPAASPPAASKPKVDRKATQVAVLNGTTQNGLAGSVANKIEDKGFTILSKGNNADQKVATTSVSFRVGSEDAAKIVAKVVDVPAGAVQPMDANLAAAVAAEANVVVVVGNNLGSTG
jgi:hypothetical protein